MNFPYAVKYNGKYYPANAEIPEVVVEATETPDVENVENGVENPVEAKVEAKKGTKGNK